MFSLKYDDTTARRALEAAPARARGAAQATEFELAQRVLDAADSMTPRRSGRLWNSRAATRTHPVEIVFAVPYARTQHEFRGVHTNGRSKFLELAVHHVEQRGGREEIFKRAFEQGLTLQSAPARHPTTPNAAGGARMRPVGRRR